MDVALISNFLNAAALFFCTYELTKRTIGSRVPEEYGPFVHMLAAIMGEVVSKTLPSVQDDCRMIAPKYKI